MAKKLAITIAGAVSLGSYEAGVLYEIIRTIQHHNGLEQDESKKIEIDVLVGASAGGMTATIAAQKLLFEASSLVEPYNNSLYRAWVKDVSFDTLFNLQTGENSTHSILSSNHVEDISKKHVTDRYASQIPAKKERHLAAADTIQLGLALTNLNGVDYIRPLRTGGQFCYTRYQDKLVKGFNASNTADDTLSAWEIVRNAAVSCGAFPFAFRVKDLIRNYDEYPSDFLPLVPNGSFPTPIRSFSYTDGGTFENEPLGMAKSLVNAIDPTHSHHDERFYLFVSPGNRAGTSNSVFSEKQADFSGAAKAITASIFNQARFRDWITAEQINEQIHILDDRATGLSQAIIAGQINPTQIKDLAFSLLPLLFGQSATAQNDIQIAQNRLRTQYQKEYDTLTNKQGKETADIWIDAILVFEKAADLGDKDEMQVFGITATEEELASSKLSAFLGFFDQAYRDHDYDVGRTKAREFIKTVHLNNNIDLWFPNHPVNNPAVTFETWMDIRPINQKLNGLKLEEVPEDLRKKFRDRIADTADNLLLEMGMSWAVRKGINLFFIKQTLNKWLNLQ